MRKQILIALAALPLAALAQGMGAGPGAGPGGGHMGHGRGMGMGPGDGERVERVEKRMRLARTLGLAEALDLDAPQALKLGEIVARFDERRLAAHKQLFDAHQAIRKAARAEKVTAAEVDQAIQKALEARAQVHAVDREMLAAVSKDLSPEKRARVFLFLEKFQGRFGPRHGGPGFMGRVSKGLRHGAGGGRMGGGQGPMGMMGPGPGDCPDGDCPWNDEDE